MKIYLLSQNQNNGYDTFDSVVVVAENEEDARNIHPQHSSWDEHLSTWCKSPKDVTVEFIGEAVEGSEVGIVCSSFNAG